MIKFCDFLDQQKEYRLADVILGNFNKTAMRKTYHSNDISFEKIIDLSSMYVLANPNSIFMKTANTPDPGPTYKDIYNFLIKIGFTPDDFKRDIFMDIVKQKFRMYTRDLRGGLTPKEQKLYETIERNGFDKADGKRVIMPDLRAKLNALAGLVFSQPDNPTGSVSRTPNQETSQPPKQNSGSSSESTPSDTKSNTESNPDKKPSNKSKLPSAAQSAAITEAATQQAKRNLLHKFIITLKDLFPKFSSQLGRLASSVSSWGGPAISACFLLPNSIYWIKSVIEKGWEAIDSGSEIASFGSFISALAGTIAGAIGALTAGPSAGTGAVAGGGLALALYGISGALNLGGFVSSFFENDDPTDNLPKAKPTTKPTTKPSPQSGSSTKPTSTTNSKPTSQTPQTPQPVKPPKKAPKTTFNPASGLGF